jgi:5-methylcytosine-specific restriction endonuclease McrA
MPTDFSASRLFAAELKTLRALRRKEIKRLRPKRPARSSLSAANRKAVWDKTRGHCHICGGLLDGDKWCVDHVVPRARGGVHELNNYLPTHSLCNKLKRCVSDVEFQWILKLGVWLRGEVERQTQIGREAGQKFCRHKILAGRRN